jgi:MFS family permease
MWMLRCSVHIDLHRVTHMSLEPGILEMSATIPVASPVRVDVAAPRYLYFLLIFQMYAISYGDRAALSIALPALGVQFHLTPIQMGWIGSSFLWSYFLLNLPSSILVDIAGARIVGSVAVALWSSAMLLGGMARNLVQFILARVLLGAGEAPTVGIGNTIVRNWALPRERGTVMTMVLAGMQVGLACGTIGGAYLIEWFGWRMEFIILGALGTLWSLAWWLIYRDPKHSALPERKTVIRLSEIALLFRSRSFFGILATQCTGNYLNFLVMTWMPLYLIHVLHIKVLASGTGTAICYIAAALGAVALGNLAERLVIRKNADPVRRKWVVAVCLLGSASIGLLPAFHTALPILATLAISLGFLIAANGANTAMLTELVDDSSKIGAVSGVTLTFSNSLGLLAPIITGYIVASTGSFSVTWYICCAALVIAGMLSLLMVGNPIRMHRNEG